MKKFLFLLLATVCASTAHGAQSEQDRALTGGYRNTLLNPGFEAGKANWTASGGATTTTTTTSSNVSSGNAAYDWDSNSASQTLTSSAVTVPAGLFGRNIEASCNFKCASGTCTHTIGFWDGTTLTNAATITSSSTYARTTVNGIAASSGTFAIRITSVSSNEPELFVDDCYIGEARNIGSVSQATFVGSAYIAGTLNCTGWSRTNTALGAFSSDADCPGPTVESNPGPGTIQTTDTDLPKFTVNNLPPGQYQVIVNLQSSVSSSSTHASYAINDGTTTSLATSSYGHNSIYAHQIVVGNFTYTTTANRTFELYGAANTGNVVINNDDSVTGKGPLTFSIFRFPSTPEQAYRADTAAMSWSGYTNSISGGCSTTSTTFADPSSCTSIALTELTNRNFGTVTTAGSSLPGITFTPVRTGRYQVCATPAVSNSSAGSDMSARLTDGTTVFYQGSAMSLSTANNASTIPMCGIYNATANTATTIKVQLATSAGTLKIATSIQGGGTVANINWSIFALDQAFPAPVLVGPRSYVAVSGGNGHGATATKRRRFTTILENVGTAITLTQSSVNGDTFTINSNGIYAMSYNDGYSGGAFEAGITRNSNGTTSVGSVTDADLLVYYTSPGGSALLPMSTTRYLTAGTVIEAVTDGTADRTTAKQVRFSITKVSD